MIGELRLASEARQERELILDFVALRATKSKKHLFFRVLAELYACSTF